MRRESQAYVLRAIVRLLESKRIPYLRIHSERGAPTLQVFGGEGQILDVWIEHPAGVSESQDKWILRLRGLGQQSVVCDDLGGFLAALKGAGFDV